MTDKTPSMTPSKQDWWRHGTIYQIYPRSFQSHQDGSHGTLAGITERLEYVRDLGVSAVWISPFFTSPMRDFGYDVSDHRAIDPMFGTISDFDALIKTAHDLNLRILIDLVLSHTSQDHPWFTESRGAKSSPASEYYVWSDAKPDGTPPNNWLSIFGGPAWTWCHQREQYYFHNFLESQPDLNFHHPDVCKEALDIARWWLERGVDGFRLDTVNFYFHDQALRDNPLSQERNTALVDRSNPYGWQVHLYDKNRPEVIGFLEALGELTREYGAVTLGEVGAEPDVAARLIPQYVNSSRLHLCYSFDLLSKSFTPAHFKDFIQGCQRTDTTQWQCVAFSNHDVIRTASRFNPTSEPEKDISRLAMALLLTLPGTPCIYQGEELGLPEAEIPFEQIVDPYGKEFYPVFKGRDGCRTPMPWFASQMHCGFSQTKGDTWLPIPKTHRDLAVDLQIKAPDSMLNHTRRLLKFRRNTPGLRALETCVISCTDDFIAHVRGAADERVLCVFNFSSKVIELNSWLAALPDQWTRHRLSDGGFQAASRHEVKAWSYALYTLNSRR